MSGYSSSEVLPHSTKVSGVPLVPGVVDEASSHIGRVAHVVKKARQKSVCGQSWDIASFETIADQIDSADERYTSRSGNEMRKIQSLTRPYLVLKTVSGIYIVTMNPLCPVFLLGQNLLKLTSPLISRGSTHTFLIW